MLDRCIDNPSNGLPEDIFLFISRNIPVVGADLLIKDENNRTLLSWRDNKCAETGWHIPGGILRLKETLEDRVKKVAEIEINTEIGFDHTPLKLTQFILDQKERCHIISFLLPATFIPDNNNLLKNDVGFIM
jgi:colanic acid biosynthesis protein WcaH